MLPMDELLCTPPDEEIIDAKERFAQETVDFRHSFLDVTPLIISLSNVSSLTHEVIFHTAYFIEHIPCSVDENPFSVLSAKISSCFQKRHLVEECLYLIHSLAVKFPGYIDITFVHILLGVMDASPAAFDGVISIFLAYCQSSSSSQQLLVFDENTVKRLVELSLSHISEIEIDKCFTLFKYFIVPFPLLTSDFISSIIKTPYCRISAFFSFLIGALELSDLITLDLMEILVHQCNYIKINDVEAYISLLLNILLSDGDFIAFITDNKLITKLVHFAKPCSSIITNFPHEKLLVFCNIVFPLLSIEALNKEIDNIVIDYFITLLYIDNTPFVDIICRVIGFLLTMYYDHFGHISCNIRIAPESLVQVREVLIASQDDHIQLCSALMTHHSLYLITDTSAFTYYLEHTIFDTELLEYLATEITDDSDTYAASISILMQVDELKSNSKCEIILHEQLSDEILPSESQISSNVSYNISDSYEYDVYSYEEEECME